MPPGSLTSTRWKPPYPSAASRTSPATAICNGEGESDSVEMCSTSGTERSYAERPAMGSALKTTSPATCKEVALPTVGSTSTDTGCAGLLRSKTSSPSGPLATMARSPCTATSMARPSIGAVARS